jgi:steroid delta-isomerase-like uncharacterized protein
MLILSTKRSLPIGKTSR